MMDTNNINCVFDFSPRKLIHMDQASRQLKLCDGFKDCFQDCNEMSIVVLSGMQHSKDRVGAILDLIKMEYDDEKFKNYVDKSEIGVHYLGSLDFMESGKTVFFLDVNEGYYVDGSEHNHSLYQIGVALSSLFVYIHDGDVSLSTIVMLSSVSDYAEYVRSESKEYNVIQEGLLPSFLWIVENAQTSKSTTNTTSNLKVPDCLTIRGSGNKIEKSIENLLAYEHVGNFIRNKSNSGQEHNIRQILIYAPPVKKIFGSCINGDMIESFFNSIVQDMNTGSCPDLIGGYGNIIQEKCSKVASEALQTYEDCMSNSVSTDPPISDVDFQQCHLQLKQLAMDMYHTEAKYKSDSRRSIKKKLLEDIEKSRNKYYSLLKMKSRSFCHELKKRLQKSIFDNFHKISNFQLFEQAFESFLTSYMEKACGPEKIDIILSFFQNEMMPLFKQFEVEMLTSDNSEDMRQFKDTLKLEWESKKNEMEQQFLEKETNLKLSVQREKETFEKLRSVTESRLKIQGGNSRRLEKELEQLKNSKSTIEHDLAASESHRKDLINKNDFLHDQVQDMKEKVSQSMETCEKMQDALNLTIASSNKKEEELMSEIGDLKRTIDHFAREETEKFSLMKKENQKLMEEKQHLQEKLSDLFFKVSSLPISLQKHFFCDETREQKVFADVLSSYVDNE